MKWSHSNESRCMFSSWRYSMSCQWTKNVIVKVQGLSSKVSSFLNPMPAHRKLSVSWQNVNRAHAQQICPASLGAIMNWRGSKMKKHIFRQIHILVIVLLSLHHCGAKVSDERLCADPECNSKFSFCLHTCLVSLGRSLHRLQIRIFKMSCVNDCFVFVLSY